MCTHICVCLCTCMFIGAHKCMCGGQSRYLYISINHSPPYFFKTRFLTKPGVLQLARQACQESPGIYLSPLLIDRITKVLLYPIFYLSTRKLNYLLFFVQKALYFLSHLSSPKILLNSHSGLKAGGNVPPAKVL